MIVHSFSLYLYFVRAKVFHALVHALFHASLLLFEMYIFHALFHALLPPFEMYIFMLYFSSMAELEHIAVSFMLITASG